MFHRDTLKLEKDERVREQTRYCDELKTLMLGYCGLTHFPLQVLEKAGQVEKVTRLDLSQNYLTEISPRISEFTNLRELWLCNNLTLNSLPLELQYVTRLEVLDLRYTNISHLQKEFASLTNLNEVDWRDTPLELTLKAQGVEVNDVFALKALLVALNERSILEVFIVFHVFCSILVLVIIMMIIMNTLPKLMSTND